MGSAFNQLTTQLRILDSNGPTAFRAFSRRRKAVLDATAGYHGRLVRPPRQELEIGAVNKHPYIHNVSRLMVRWRIILAPLFMRVLIALNPMCRGAVSSETAPDASFLSNGAEGTAGAFNLLNYAKTNYAKEAARHQAACFRLGKQVLPGANL
jgi:hypothetical protein